MLQNIPYFEPWLRALVEPSRWPKLEKDWKRLSGGQQSGDCEITCLRTYGKSPKWLRGGGQSYRLERRELGGAPGPISGYMSHADALLKLRPHVTPVLKAHRNALKAFDASPEARKVLITPGEVLKAHKIDLTFKWLTEKSPSYFPAMADPGPLDSNGKPTNPRYQPGLGGRAKRTFGVPHPCIGMPVGDFLGYQRASSLARPKHALNPSVRCPPGVPFPEPRPPAPANKKPRKK